MNTPYESRRGFLKASAMLAGTSLLATSTVAKARASVADRIRVGVVGIRGRGAGLIHALQKLQL